MSEGLQAQLLYLTYQSIVLTASRSPREVEVQLDPSEPQRR